MCTCQTLKRWFMWLNRRDQELPKPFLVSLICTWLTALHYTMFSAHPHTSVTSLCAETVQSGWWVLSVNSGWNFFRKTCSERQQLLPPRHYSFHIVVNWSFEIQGQCLFSSLFLSFFCPVLCDWLSDNKHSGRCLLEIIYRFCQMPVRCRVALAE